MPSTFGQLYRKDFDLEFRKRAHKLTHTKWSHNPAPLFTGSYGAVALSLHCLNSYVSSLIHFFISLDALTRSPYNHGHFLSFHYHSPHYSSVQRKPSVQLKFSEFLTSINKNVSSPLKTNRKETCGVEYFAVSHFEPKFREKNKNQRQYRVVMSSHQWLFRINVCVSLRSIFRLALFVCDAFTNCCKNTT